MDILDAWPMWAVGCLIFVGGMAWVALALYVAFDDLKPQTDDPKRGDA